MAQSMKTILLEELDPRTSEWLRETSRHEGVIVMEAGAPMLTITPAGSAQPPPARSRKRILLPEFEAIMDQLGRGGTDSGQMISEDRDRRPE